MPVSGHIAAARYGNAGCITLDRPEKLNALTLAMIRELSARFDEFDRDDAVRLVVLAGTGRGFCAGGDIRRLHESGRTRDGYARRFWAEEYRLVARIAAFRKPVVVLMTGIVMGGGVGLSAHARHRIVTETTRLAMPEVGIGLIPDVGATWLLSHAPGETGTYLALTGKSVGAADALFVGAADYYVPSAVLADVPGLHTERCAHAEKLPSYIAGFARRPDPSPLAAERTRIDRSFAYDTVEDILASLHAEDDEFARATAEQIEARSPLSVKLTLKALRIARGLADLTACLQLEYRLVCRLLDGHDFQDGSSAAVIRKDRSPTWHPARLRDVSDDMVDGYFATLGDDEFVV